MKKTQILILAAGHVPFDSGDFSYPPLLAEHNGAVLCEHIIANTKGIDDARYIYAFKREDIERFHLDRMTEVLTPGATVVSVPRNTKGSACTALLAACQLDPDDELLVVSANELVDTDYNAVVCGFRTRGLDAGVLIFRSLHPRYSYVKLGDDGLAIEFAQQRPISHYATTGTFWFSRTADFVEAVKNMIRKDAHVNGNFYIAPALNEIILRHGKVGVENLPNDLYLPLKTQRQLYQFESGVHA